jgi:surface antigen
MLAALDVRLAWPSAWIILLAHTFFFDIILQRVRGTRAYPRRGGQGGRVCRSPTSDFPEIGARGHIGVRRCAMAARNDQNRCTAVRMKRWLRAVCPVSALSLALLAGACGMSSKLGLSDATTSNGASGGASGGAKTASIDLISALSMGAFSDDDLIVASVATASLLARGTGGPWENPQTGARGTITPIAAAYRDNGVECRDFLASYVHDKAEAWMQGEACRTRAGRWEVRSLKPWRR